jgi:hypothetical protein
MTDPDPIVDPAVLPDLLPHDTTTWSHVANRGPNAAGLLTMPIFLVKFGTRRARAHVLYNAFLCKDFIAPPGLALPPSTDPNLMTRPGCSTCHATLEPMAAYFTRFVESDVFHLPAADFPVSTASGCTGAAPHPAYCVCKTNANGLLPGSCNNYFDPAFSDGQHAVLRGAYPDALGGTTHANDGPTGLGNALASSPEFAGCVAQNVASSFLGRPLTDDDAALKTMLATTLTGGGYKMRAVVRALVKSGAYGRSNNVNAYKIDGGAR